MKFPAPNRSITAGIAIPDDAVLAFAITKKRVLLTINRKHFIRLHLITLNHHAIIVCTSDPHFGALAQRIHHTITITPDMNGQLIRVNRPG